MYKVTFIRKLSVLLSYIFVINKSTAFLYKIPTHSVFQQPLQSRLPFQIEPSLTSSRIHLQTKHVENAESEFNLYALPNRKSKELATNKEMKLSNKDDMDIESPKMKIIGPLIFAAIIAAIALYTNNISGGVDINTFVNQIEDKISSLGPVGYLYFAIIYVLAEVLAIPAMPLTASSGYLFGILPGFLTVLFSASLAASISFFVGRTFLRQWVLDMASHSKEWRAIDKAVEKQGFKVVLLLRLSPLLPFALSNYLYGITSVNFWSYFAATLLGFAPGTFGIVYAGTAGKALFTDDGPEMPWYIYVGGLALFLFIGQTIAKVATEAIRNIEEEEATLNTTKESK